VRGARSADPTRMELVLDAGGLEVVHCELPRGGAVFFHCNTLHSSDTNRSLNPRWGFICCYNTRTNGRLKGTANHPSFDMVGELETWDDAELLRLGVQQWARLEARAAL
jgi:ectoine hydroxylase